MRRICSAVAKSTGEPCKRTSAPGSTYCIFHMEKRPIIYGALASVLLGLLFGYLISLVCPSQELRELRQLRLDVQPLISLAESRYPNLERSSAFEALSKEVGDIRQVLDSMNKYGELARVDFYGQIHLGGGVGTSSALYGWAKKFAELKKEKRASTGEINYRIDAECSPDALNQYRSIIEKYPFWPFVHAVMAKCLKAQGDKAWMVHARVAFYILKKTSEVPNHDKDHSIVKKIVYNLITS